MTRRATRHILFACALFSLPAAVSAAPLDLVTQDIQVKNIAAKLSALVKLPNTEAFCAGLAETKTKLGAAVEAKEKSVAAYVEGLPERLENERNGRDAKLEEARSEADQERSVWYARLEDRADSDDEEDAVARYQKRVEEAVDDRRESIDAAIAEFRTGADALAVKRPAALQSARDAFRASVEAGTKKLESDCANGVSTAVLLQDFKAGLKTGREFLTADKQSAATLEANLKVLAETRKKSVASAVAAFNAEVTAANAELKMALAAE